MIYPHTHNSLSRQFLSIYATMKYSTNTINNGLRINKNHPHFNVNYALRADVLYADENIFEDKQIIIK